MGSFCRYGRELVCREDGATLVFVTLWLLVLALFLAFVVDVGNWYVHKRHLQSQADAGALAGGGVYAFPCQDAKVVGQARRYSGDPSSSGFNAQVEPVGSVVVLLNSAKYYNEGGSDYSDGGSPCTTSFVDVRITESDVPVFFAGLLPGISPTINARARTSMMTATYRRDNLPISVAASEPKHMRAEFIDQASGSVIAHTEMASEGVNNGYHTWSNAAAPLMVNVTERVSARLVISGGDSTACGQYLVECYDDVLFIHGFTGAGSPVLGDVRLTPGSCSDGYHVYLETGVSCQIGIEAVVDFPEPAPPPPPVDIKPSLTAVVNGNSYDLERESGDLWTGAGLPVSADQGPVDVILKWAQKAGKVGTKKCPCDGSFGVVQQVFAGGAEISGPLRIAQISPPAGFGGFNSMNTGNHDLVVRVGLQGLHVPATAVSSKPSILRLTDPKTSSLDCDPATPNFRDELGTYCKPFYRVNANPFVNCETLPNGPPSLPQPWPCIRLQPGASVGQAVQGMGDQVLRGQSCAAHPNNWLNFPDLDYANDSRIVSVFVLPFGALSSPPNAYISVLGLAEFYVTGWGQNPACPGDQNVPRGSIIGHFIKTYDHTNYGAQGPCDLTSLNICVAVLTH